MLKGEIESRAVVRRHSTPCPAPRKLIPKRPANTFFFFHAASSPRRALVLLGPVGVTLSRRDRIARTFENELQKIRREDYDFQRKNSRCLRST